jgi:hypothetical protein
MQLVQQLCMSFILSADYALGIMASTDYVCCMHGFHMIDVNQQ